jgi:hypothetical protein
VLSQTLKYDPTVARTVTFTQRFEFRPLSETAACC